MGIVLLRKNTEQQNKAVAESPRDCFILVEKKVFLKEITIHVRHQKRERISAFIVAFFLNLQEFLYSKHNKSISVSPLGSV
jgi:hypothetical protein